MDDGARSGDLGDRTIKDFPEYYKIYSEMDFTFNNIKQGNRNPLLYKNVGADGLKTGHTEEAGYSLTASVVRGDRRIVMVLGGLPTMKSRAEESERLIEWAFREYNDYRLFSSGDTVDEAPVWLGADARVPLTVAKDLVVTLPRRARAGMKVTVEYDSPLPAPITKGEAVGKIVITAPGTDADRGAADRRGRGPPHECGRPYRDARGLSGLGPTALSRMPRGRFITVEGGEGAGKSTQVALLVAALERAGISALATREPGGSARRRGDPAAVA